MYIKVVVFNATFKNISVISWRTVLLEDEIGTTDMSQDTNNLYHISGDTHRNRTVTTTTTTAPIIRRQYDNEDIQSNIVLKIMSYEHHSTCTKRDIIRDAFLPRSHGTMQLDVQSYLKIFFSRCIRVLGVSILPLISRTVLWLSGVMVLGWHGGGYSRNASCALNMISTFLLFVFLYFHLIYCSQWSNLL
jgi:hypothetical protein